LNARHPAFEPGTDSRNGGIELNQWSIDNNMSYIGEPGEATHQAGHVLDLTFSNIPFATTEVVEDLYCGSDHFTLPTVNRTRNGTCVNRVVLVLWKERAMYEGASWALSPERASAKVKMG
jgi:hypothetical protein